MRTANSILLGTGITKEIDKVSLEKDIPYMQIYGSFYMIVCDLLSIISYTLYLKKDTENLVVLIMDSSTDTDNSCVL